MWPDEEGGGTWDPAMWQDDSGTVATNGPQVQANDILTQSVETSGPDRWSGFFQNILGGALQYAVQKDAIKSGLTPARASNGQTVYVPQAQAPVTGTVGGMNMTALLIIGGFVLAGVMLVRK